MDGQALRSCGTAAAPEGELVMVSGDYRDPATFSALARGLQEAGSTIPARCTPTEGLLGPG